MMSRRHDPHSSGQRRSRNQAAACQRSQADRVTTAVAAARVSPSAFFMAVQNARNGAQPLAFLPFRYRMVFGQNRQEDLVSYLAARLPAEATWKLLDLCRLDLTPPQVSAPVTG
jgi:hypothetical protein